MFREVKRRERLVPGAAARNQCWAASPEGGSGVAAHGGEEAGELQAEEHEGDAGEPAEEKARDGEAVPPGFDVHAHGIAPTRAEAGGDDGQRAGDVAGLGREAGGEME